MSAYAYKNKAQSKSQQRAFFGGSAAVFSKPGTCTGFARHRLLCMGGLGWFRVIKVPPGPAGSRSVRRSQGKKSNYRRSFKLGQPTLTRVSSLAFVVDLPDLAKATPQQTASTSLSTAVRCTSHCSEKLQKAQVLQFQDGLHSFPMPAARGSRCSPRMESRVQNPQD